MRQTPELDRVQAKMQPGELTLHGFLGTDTRKLVDILLDDHKTVIERGVSHAAIADRLAALTEKGRDLMEQIQTVEDRYNMRVRDDRGVLPSPWGDGRFGKGDVEMTDTVTGRSFRWNELTLHMVRQYGFYGGKGSHYRLEPAALIDILGLQPESEDTPETPLESS